MSFILFNKCSTYDCIYSINIEKEFGKILYKGNLNFSLDHPIETLYSYESDSVEKIYWVDGRNQPRVINIKKIAIEGNDTQFDFNPAVKSDIEVSITKQFSGDGMFAPGVIQYIITYYNNNAQESAPVYISPIYYITDSNKGVSVEDTASCNFIILSFSPYQES
jgi:hypothetical protein